MVDPSTVVVGIDEAGRGALAGPVVAGACYVPNNIALHAGVQDSKSLTPEQRKEAYAWITQHCIWSVGQRSASFVDDHGILEATEKAMQDAVAALALNIKPTYLLVDGRDKFWFDYPHSSVVRGDESESCISAASVIAKVHRDTLMIDLSTEYPVYGLEKHKGYGTPEHYAALQEHGLSCIHRKTFIESDTNTSPSRLPQLAVSTADHD